VQETRLFELICLPAHAIAFAEVVLLSMVRR
jgi:hypothetical protein